MRLAVLVVCILATGAVGHAQTADSSTTTIVQRIRESAQFAQASTFIEGDYDRFVKELDRAQRDSRRRRSRSRRARRPISRCCARHGLSDVEIDAEGNVMGVRKGTAAGGPMLAVVAHLDTVFPEGTDVKVKREGTRLAAPGIGDNTRGLALMLAVVRAMQAGEVPDDERHPVRRQRRRGRRGRSARRQVPAAQGQVQGSDQAVHRHRRRRAGQHHARRRRQPALPRDLQGPRRPQLRRVRAGQPGVRDGQRDREVLAAAGAGRAQDDVQRRRRQRRHVGQLDSVRGQHGRRHAVGIVRRAEEGERGVSGDRRSRPSTRRTAPLDARREDRGRSEADRRSAVRRDAAPRRRSCRRRRPWSRPSA